MTVGEENEQSPEQAPASAVMHDQGSFRDRLYLRINFMALLVGVVAGLGAVLFRDLIGFFHNLLFFGRFDVQYDALVHTVASPWGIGVILVPVIGAVGVVFLVKNFAPEAKGHGVPEVMYAISYQRGIIRPQVAVVKSIASALSIGSGGAIGREGPIIQIGAAFGSLLGQLGKLPEWERLTLIACGAGGGIAATFNTPIGGILFAVELMMVEISARTLIPVMLATGMSTVIGDQFFGDKPSFLIPHLAMGVLSSHPVLAYLAAAALGVGVGVLAAVFTLSIYAFEDAFDAMPGNYYTRHIIGMLMVGGLMYLTMQLMGHYYIEGVGYATIQSLLDGHLSVAWILLVLIGLKLLATSLTLGSGASGGIFSPSLFVGAGAGGAFALGMRHIFPDLPIDVVGAAVIGMACMVGAATGAAVTAVVMIFEMTRDYQVIIPLIIAVSIAYGTRRLLMTENIYTLKLSRRGHQLSSILESPLYLMRNAHELVPSPFIRLSASTGLEEVKAMLKPRRPIPHVLLAQEEGGQFSPLGVVSSARLEKALKDGKSIPLRALLDPGYLIMTLGTPVFDLIAEMRRTGFENVVLTHDGRCSGADDIVAVISQSDIMRYTNLPHELARQKERPGVS